MPELPPMQPANRPVRVGHWLGDEDFPVHPVGSKPKRMLICPAEEQEPYLIPRHAYLFKMADGWRAQQIWSEVIAYRLAALVGLDVPPCFVAVDETSGRVGALIEFFYGYPHEAETARLIHAVDVFHRVRTGRAGLRPERPHTVKTNLLVCRALRLRSEIDWWGRVLTFDALIGNTDRHTENWGFLVRQRRGTPLAWSFAPPFDTGTSLGYEISEKRLHLAADPKWLAAYIERGKHHCGWDLAEDHPTPHISLCARFLEGYPGAGAAMRSVIRFDMAQITGVLDECTQFDVDVPFTAARARFVAATIEARRAALSALLEAEDGKLD